MIRTQSLHMARATVMAVAMLASAAYASTPAALAQEGTPTAAASAESRIEPNRADAGEIWTPPAGTTFDIGANPTVSVRVDAPYSFAATATYQRYDPSVGYGTPVSITVNLSNSGLRAEMSVTFDPNTIEIGSAVIFQISSSDGTVTTTSPVYGLSRGTKLRLPFLFRTAGAIPLTILATGANACDALNNHRGGPLSPSLSYFVQGTSTESWFFTYNATPGATIVVSLTNYTSVAGQLQVFREQAGCGALAPLLAFGTNPNPVVTVTGLPAGRVYFRVISGVGQPAPPPYIISWSEVSNSGSFEPNNNPCQATPTQPGVQYTTLSDDQYDFFAMNITGTAQIQVVVQSFTIGSAQVQVRSPLKAGFSCPGNGEDPVNSTNRIDPFGVVPPGGGDVSFNVNIPGPGLYYIRVSLPPNVAGNNQPYRISWNYAGGLPDTRDPLFTSNPNQPYNPPYNGDILFNINTGDTATYYWSGLQSLGSYDTIQVRVEPKGDLQGCGLGDVARINPPSYGNNWVSLGTTAPRGSISIQFNAIGGYKIMLRVLQSSTVRFFDEKPLKVSCGTLMTSRQRAGAVDWPPFQILLGELDDPHP